MAERFSLIYVVKYYPVTRLPDREISLPDYYPVIYYPARVLQSLILTLLYILRRNNILVRVSA